MKIRLLLSVIVFCSAAKAFALLSYEENLSCAPKACEYQSELERKKTFQKGLLQTLERFSGKAPSATALPVQQALENINQYIEQFAYDGETLTVKYSADLIQRLMQKMGETVLSEQKNPAAVIWIAVEEAQGRRLIGAEAEPDWQTHLNKLAPKGLSLILPLMDLEDMTLVTANDVWGVFPSILKQASSRYKAQLILVAKLIKLENSEWQGTWKILGEGDMPSWDVQGTTKEEVLSLGVKHASAHLAQMHAAQTPVQQWGPAKPILMAIQNVQTAADFAKVETYLAHLDQVSKVQLYEVGNNNVVFAVTPQQNSNSAAIKQAISLHHQLEHAFSPQGSEAVDLAYRWITAAE